MQWGNPDPGYFEKGVVANAFEGASGILNTVAATAKAVALSAQEGLEISSRRNSLLGDPLSKVNGALIAMAYAAIGGPTRAEDLIGRALELEQMANLVSYAADKARLRERAGRLREEALRLPAAADSGLFGIFNRHTRRR